MSNKKTTKPATPKTKSAPKNEIKLDDGEGILIDVYLKKIKAMFDTLSDGGKLGLFHLIIDSNKALNEERNKLIKEFS